MLIQELGTFGALSVREGGIQRPVSFVRKTLEQIRRGVE